MHLACWQGNRIPAIAYNKIIFWIIKLVYDFKEKYSGVIYCSGANE